jgi:hypothetical protein
MIVSFKSLELPLVVVNITITGGVESTGRQKRGVPEISGLGE